MTTPRFCRFVLSILTAMFALVVPTSLWAQPSTTPLSNNPGKLHTITIAYSNGAWSYSIHPAQANPLKAKVKRGDTVNWICHDGSWQVFFKDGATPLVNSHGAAVFTVDGGSGAANGAYIGVKAKDGDSFSYGVKVNLNGGGTVVDDPEIIIDSDDR